LERIEQDGVGFVEGGADEALMHCAADGARLIEACFSAHTRRALLYAANLPAAFFDVSSGQAGEILQKLRSFHIRFAVVCPPGVVQLSTRFPEILADDFQVFETRKAALDWLTR
jgi:hypothetical protein